jgi:hypothetical protein
VGNRVREDEPPDREILEYTLRLIGEKQKALECLKQNYECGLIQADEFFSCAHSLRQATQELQSVLRILLNLAGV